MKLIESETLNSTIASFFYENAFAFNVADSPGLQLWLICVNLTVYTLACAHEHSISQSPAACVAACRIARRRRARTRASAARAAPRAGTRMLASAGIRGGELLFMPLRSPEQNAPPRRC